MNGFFVKTNTVYLYGFLVAFQLYLFLLSNNSFGQFTMHSKIYDQETKRPVPFANIAAFKNGLIGGTSTNLDGNFELKLTQTPDSIVVSCVGYQRLRLTSFNLTYIQLQPKETRFSDILILPGENPALRIIRNAVKLRDANDIEHDQTFSYTSYTVFNADIEELDSTTSAEIRDSSALKTLEYFKNKQAFVSETFSKVHYRPTKIKQEIVVAAKTAGMKNPIFSIFANQIQPFSAYSNPIELFSTEYLNPFSESGVKGYFFVLRDSTVVEKDTIFTIDFQPKPKTTFSGSRGTVYINSSDWSINKIIFNFPNPFGLALAQQDSESSILMGEEVGDDNLATIIIRYEKNGAFWAPKEVRTIYPLGKIKSGAPFNIYNTSYFSNYLFGSDAQRVKTHGAPVQVADDASAVDDDTWRIIRGGKSNIRMDSTYLFLDSVSKSGKFDRLTALMLGAAEGKLKVKFLDIDLNKTLVFNDFEGFRLGVGLETNERMLKFLRVGGFFGYGFRDKTWKYGGHMRWIFVSQMQFQARASYQFDVSPTGLFSFQDPTGRIDQGELIRTAYIRQMDYVESYAFDLGSYLFRSAHLKITTASKNVQTGYAYSFQFPENAQTASNFSLFETGAEFNWRIKDRYIQMGSTRLNLNEPRFPVIQVQYTQGLDNLLNGTINYSRFLVRISQQFLWFRFGQLSIRGEYQKTLGNVPVPLLIYTPGILLRQFGVGSNNIFETVRPNEFLNDELLTGFFRFNFNPWVWKKNKLEPIVSLRFNAGVGRLNNIERHQEIQFSTMNRGFYEAGVVFERLINAGIAGYGLGIYYRLGAYSAVKPIENIAFKLTLSLGS